MYIFLCDYSNGMEFPDYWSDSQLFKKAVLHGIY